MHRQLFGLLTICAYSLPCAAQQTPSEEDSHHQNGQLEEITVTAHRIAAPSILPVETLSVEDLTTAGSLIGPDALISLTSLAVAHSGAFGSQAQVRARGAEANHIQVLVDGIEFNDPATGSEFPFAHLDLAGVDRVEFLPGAQSALWGSDALAGVLNLLSAPTDDLSELELLAGSHGERLGRIDLGDTLLAGHYRLTLTDYATDGTNTALQGDEEDGYEHTSGHLNARLEAGDLGMNLVLRHLNASSEFDPTGFPTYLPTDGDNVTDVEMTAGKIGVDGTLFDGSLTQTLELKGLASTTATDSENLRVSRFEGERSGVTSISHWQIAEGHALTGLLEYEQEGFRQRAAASIFGDPNYDESVNTRSAALEYIARGSRLSGSLSVRRDLHSEFEDISSYRAAVRLVLGARLALFASHGTGTKNPSFIERFGYTPDSFVGNPNLRPEFNRHVSLGLDWRTGEVLSLRLSAFQDELEDEINGFAWTGAGFTAENLDGTSDRKGVEVQARLVLNGTRFKASYTLVDSNAPDGEAEVRRPRHQGFIALSRHLLAGKLMLSAVARLTSGHLDLDFSTGQQRRLHLPSRQLVHLSARYQLTDRLEAHLRLANLLDDDSQEVYGYATPGRTASIGVRLRW